MNPSSLKNWTSASEQARHCRSLVLQRASRFRSCERPWQELVAETERDRVTGDCNRGCLELRGVRVGELAEVDDGFHEILCLIGTLESDALRLFLHALKQGGGVTWLAVK